MPDTPTFAPTGPTVRGWFLSLLLSSSLLVPLPAAMAAPAPSPSEKELRKQIDPSNWRLNSESQLFYYYLLLSDGLSDNNRTVISVALEALLRLDPSLPVYQDSATILMARGEFVKAEEVSRRGLRLFPDDTLLVLLLASAYSENGQLQKGIELLEKSLQKKPDTKEFKESLVRLYLAAGDAQKASALMTQLPEGQNSDESQLFRIRVMSSVGRNAEAIALLHDLLKKSPSLAEAWVELGILYERQKQPENAIRAYESALSLAPGNAELAFRLAVLYIDTKQPEKAVEALEKTEPTPTLFIQSSLRFADADFYTYAIQMLEKAAAIGADPDEVALFRSMYAQESGDNPLDGLPALESIKTDSRLYPAAVQQKVRIYMQAERYTKAFAIAHEGRVAYPERKELWGLEAYALIKLDRAKEAEKLLLDSLKQYPDDLDLLFSLGSVQDEIGKKDAAMETMEKIIFHNPKHYQALNYIGYTLAEKNIDLQRALVLVTAALEENPDADFIVDSLAWVQYRLGRYDDAWKSITRCIELGGDDATIWEHYGDIAVKVDKKDEAIKGYTEALLRKPDNVAELRDKLTRLKQ